MDRKTVAKAQIKDADEGMVEAVFATLNVRDHDGDVILPGAFESGQKVRISAYNHSSWGGALPVGRGEITEEGNEAIFRGQFFMDSQQARDTFGVVKGLGELAEYSFGFDLRKGATREGEHQGEPVQFIGPLPDGTAGIVTHEVSPVLLGAGIGTRTLAVKGLKDASIDDLVKQLLTHDPDEVAQAIAAGDLKFTDHLTFVSASVKAVDARLADVSATRAAKGKEVGEESKAKAAEVLDALNAHTKTLREVTASADDTEVGLDLDVQLELERARFRL